MATDATGTPTTNYSIPKYDTANDAPSGLGFNAAMDALDTALLAKIDAPSGALSGEAAVYNGSSWVRSSVTKLGLGSLSTSGASTNDVMTYNGSAWAPAAVPAGVPAGAMSLYGASSAPSGWLLCDGTAVSRSTYAALFTAISTTYGVGDGSTTFNVPDLRGRVPVGYYASGPAEVNALGDNEGLLVNNRNISHRHSITNGSGGSGSAIPTASSGTPINQVMYTGGDTANTEYPAYLAINYIIKT